MTKRKTHNSAGTQVHVLLPEKPAHCLLQDKGLSPGSTHYSTRPGYGSHTPSAIPLCPRRASGGNRPRGEAAPAPAHGQLSFLHTLQPHCSGSSWGAPQPSAHSRTARCHRSGSGCDLQRPHGKSSGWRERRKPEDLFPAWRKGRKWMTAHFGPGAQLIWPRQRRANILEGENTASPLIP